MGWSTSSSSGGHLTQDDLQEIVDGIVAVPAEVRSHLESCTGCRNREMDLRTHQASIDGLRSHRVVGKGPDCPDVYVWWKVAKGTMDAGESVSLLGHAAQCDHCGEALRLTLA